MCEEDEAVENEAEMPTGRTGANVDLAVNPFVILLAPPLSNAVVEAKSARECVVGATGFTRSTDDTARRRCEAR